MTTNPTTSPMDDLALLPCPFCGVEAVMVPHSLELSFSVRCGGCQAQMPYVGLTEEEAIAEWNTRSPIASREEEVERVAENIIVPIGSGEIVSNWGTYYGTPAVFLQPPPNGPGPFGERVPEADDYASDSLPPGTVILLFKGLPTVLLEDISAALASIPPGSDYRRGVAAIATNIVLAAFDNVADCDVGLDEIRDSLANIDWSPIEGLIGKGVGDES